jgi:Fibronectin type III domain
MAKKVLRQLFFLATTVILVACGGGGDGGTPSASTSQSGATSPAPQSTASVTLAWNPNTEPDLAGYKIYEATSPGSYGAAIATLPANATSFVATGLQPGVTYFFVITAYDTSGNESARSPELSATASL